MRFQGFIGPSYTLQSFNVDCQRCINLYPEMDETGTGNESEVASLVSTPGLKLLCPLPTGPVRGAYTDSSGQLWAVGGDVLYKISNLWAATPIGTLNTSTGPVSISDNGFQLVVVDGPFGYMVVLSSSIFSQITDPNFLGASQVDFMDGYLLFIEPNSQQFFFSPLNAVTPFDGLDIASAEASPDNLVGLEVLQETIYFFGSQSIEIWYDSGNADLPFQRIQGSVLEVGCDAPFSISKIQNAVYWLGRDKNGHGVVYRAEGMQFQRISTFAIESVMRSLGDLSGARAWTYAQAGHTFYALNIPGASTTWVFDTVTSLWHERAYLSAGQYQRHPADCHAFAYNTNVVGDYSNGNIYALDSTEHTDNGNPIVRERSAPHLSKDMLRLFHSKFQLDIEVGVGTDGIGQGVKPQAILQWSNDYGHSWSNDHLTELGPIGARKTRVIWRRLGNARDRVYRIRISDPIRVTLLGAEIDLEQGSA